MGWKRSAGTRSLHPADAVWKGFGKFPTSIFARGRKDTEQKWQIGTSLHCLHTPRSRCLLYVVREFSTADNRLLLGLSIHIVTFQAENHIIGALKKADIPLFQLMPHLQCCKLMNCCFIKTEKQLHRKCSGFWKNAEKAGILICIHALCRLNG